MSASNAEYTVSSSLPPAYSRCVVVSTLGSGSSASQLGMKVWQWS